MTISEDVWRNVINDMAKLSGPEEDFNQDSADSKHTVDCENLESLYLDLARSRNEAGVVLAQMGQSLDGRIATESGHSHYINGQESLDHLHRLRALVDAVIVGVETVVLDDPRLTTRRVEGPSPARVILDPNGRLPETASLLHDGAAPVYVVRRGGTQPVQTAGTETLFLESEASEGGIGPHSVLSELRRRGMRSILVEGGGRTISRFISAKALDRLHIMVAPLLIGSGRAGLSLPVIETLDDAVRLKSRRFDLGGDTLFECQFLSDDEFSAKE